MVYVCSPFFFCPAENGYSDNVRYDQSNGIQVRFYLVIDIDVNTLKENMVKCFQLARPFHSRNRLEGCLIPYCVDGLLMGSSLRIITSHRETLVVFGDR